MPPDEPNVINNGKDEWIQKTFSPEFLRDTDSYEKLKPFKTVDDLGRSYLSAQKMISSSTRVPAAEAPQEEWDAFYTKWGRPRKAEEYAIPDELKKAAGDEKFLSNVLSMAHKLGLNQKQTTEMVKWGVETSAAQMQEYGAAAKQAQDSLKTEWGYAYEDNLALAKTALRTLSTGSDDPFIKLLDSTGLSNNPLVIKWFERIGRGMGEDDLVKDGQTPPEELASAAEKIRMIRGDKTHPYNDETHPNHKKAVLDMAELYKLVNGASA